MIESALADGMRIGVDTDGQLIFAGGERAMERHGATVKALPPSDVALVALQALARTLAHDLAMDNRHPEIVAALADSVAAGLKDAAKDAADAGRDGG